MRFFEVDSAVDAIMSAAMLAQTKAGSRNQQGKLSMNGFLQMLKNAGIMMDYEGFKTVYDTNPQLANVIAKFDKDSITFLSADGDDEAVDNTEPSNQTPPDERVAQMARKAVKTREFVESIVTEGAIDTLRAIVDNKQNMPIKFTDGQMKVDLFTASAITKVYDAVNDANKEKLERMMQTKAGMMKVADFAMDQVKMEDATVSEAETTVKGKPYSAAKAKAQLRQISEMRRMLENEIIKLADLDNGDLTDQLTTMFNANTSMSGALRRAYSIIPEGISEDEKYNADSSGKFQITFSNEDMDPKTEAQYLNVLKMLLKTYKNVDISDIDDVESYIMIRGLSVQEAASPTSEFDYDLKKFYKKVQELEDQNQHGEVAEMLVNLYGNDSEAMIIRGINGLHSMQGSIMPEQQKLRDSISTKYYKQLEQEVKGMKEGFASDAQRKAAFASGYKPNKKKMKERSLTKGEQKEKERIVKGMKKAKGDFKDRYGDEAKAVMYATATKLAKEDITEGMEDKIEKDIDAGMSTDAIIGKHANKRTDNTDEIRKIIQRIKFKKFKGRN